MAQQTLLNVFMMKNTIIFVLVLILLLLGCKRVGQDKVGADPEFEVSNYPDGLLDSLMWAQYHCPEGEDEMIYKWNWAYDVCDSLGIYELESLDSLTHQLEEDYKPYFGGPTPTMITAADLYAGTARFRMIKAYHVLAYMMDNTPLGGDSNDYLEDFVRWEKLYQEFDNYYNESGNIRPMNLGYYYRQIAKMRTDILLEEIALFSGESPQQDKSFVEKKPRWDKLHQAIRHWFDHRMRMADKLQYQDVSRAQCLRAFTLKAVQRYMEFTLSFEKVNYL